MEMDCLQLNEEYRLKLLRQSKLTEMVPCHELELIVQMASSVCMASMGAISIIDESKQLFKASVGIDFSETRREIAFCALLVDSACTELVIEDATKDPRFTDNPMVVGAPYIRFYAGVPITLRCGLAVGALCVFDTAPKTLSESQLESLGYLRDRVVDRFEADAAGALNATWNAFNEGKDLPLEILALMRRIEQSMDQHSKKLYLEHKVTLPQLLCLMMLRTINNVNQSELAEMLALSPSTLVGILDRLESSNFIERQRDGYDRRSTQVSLTGAGKTFIEERDLLLQSPVIESMGSLKQQDKADLHKLLTELVKRLS